MPHIRSFHHRLVLSLFRFPLSSIFVAISPVIYSTPTYRLPFHSLPASDDATSSPCMAMAFTQAPMCRFPYCSPFMAVVLYYFLHAFLLGFRFSYLSYTPPRVPCFSVIGCGSCGHVGVHVGPVVRVSSSILLHHSSTDTLARQDILQ